MAGDGQTWCQQRRPFSRGLLATPGGLLGANLPPPPPNPLGKLARPASPAAVLSYAALDHLSAPVKPPSRPGTISLGRSASTPLVAGGLALSSAGPAATASRVFGEAEALPISTRPSLGNSLQREVPSRLRAFDRRLAQDFEELDEQRQRLTTAGTVRTHSPDRSDTGLSLAARRENFRKQQYEAHIDRARTDSAGSPTGANAKNSDIGDNDFLDIMKPEAFQAEIAGVERQFEEMARSLRLEHLSEGTQADRRAAEREAERRRKEEIMRRARKKEQEARDPKKKVAIRLENKRTFEREESEKDSAIPMTRIDVGGGFKGHEEVELVDVRRMRTKCCFMEGGLDVRQMVDTMARRERQERALHYGGNRSNLAAVSSSMWSSSMTSSSSASDMLELRRKFAQDLKGSEHVEGLLRKIGTMRNKLPYALPYKFEVLNNPMLEQVLASQAAPDEAEVTQAHSVKRFIIAAPSCLPATRYKDGMSEKQRDLEVATALTEHFAATAAAAAASHAGSAKKVAGRGKLTNIVEGLGAAGHLHAGAGLVERTVSTRPRREKAGPVDEAAEAAMKKRARRRWAIARAAGKVHFLYRQCLERNHATLLIKAVLNQLGEWARIRKAMGKLRNSIKVLQATCRAFLNTKKKRCGGIEKEWQRVEDHYLQTYFKTYAQRLVSHDNGVDRHYAGQRGRNRKAKFISDAKSQQEEVKRLLEAGVEGGELSIDWRSYRIPPKERKVMISRYYMMQLRKHVRSQKHFLDAVQTAVKAERELVRFLKLFGADDDQIRSAQDPVDTSSNSLVQPPDQVEKANFWYIGEEMLLQLVNVAAQALRDAEPFRNHPANIDEYGHRSRSIGGGVPMSLDRTRRKADALRRSALAAGDLAPGGGADPDSHRGENGKLDVEEIFRGFTPRLREICEEQTIEYRNATAAGGGERAEEGQGPDGGDAADVPGAPGGAAAVAAGPGRAGPDGLLLGHANASQLPSVGGT